MCTSHRCQGRELAEGAPTSIPQLPAGPGRGKCLSRGKRVFVCTNVPSTCQAHPQGLPVLSRLQGQYCLEVALVAGHWNDRECWLVIGMTENAGLYLCLWSGQGVLDFIFQQPGYHERILFNNKNKNTLMK